MEPDYEKDYAKLKRIIAQNIRRYRLFSKLTQEQAAEKAGVSTNFWQRMELQSQVSVPSMLTLVKISKALKIKPNQLLEP